MYQDGLGFNESKQNWAQNGTERAAECSGLHHWGIQVHPIEQQPEIVRVERLKKVYKSGQTDLVLFENLSFQVRKGEILAIVGESGAGKSSLLHIMGALDRASEGDVYCAQIPVMKLSDDAAADFRNREIGFVWQFHYLLPEFTAQENVAMPLLMRGEAYQPAMEKAGKWLREVNLENRSHHRAGELSGGEQQRVALARALVTGPKILMADEPTGDLDNRTAEMVFDLIQRLHRDYQLTSLIVTHNLDFARRCDRVLRLRQGQVEEVSPRSLAQ
ncbi:MAG TPA: ABC transporter ATP-binding protein [Candidatus Angelobacter sp.]|nr:ABC transporter ATP-binding protein [Candidatus Angelobacter sp.]